MNGEMKEVSDKRRLLVRFNDECEKDQTLNKLTPLTLYRIPTTKEAKVTIIYVIPD